MPHPAVSATSAPVRSLAERRAYPLLADGPVRRLICRMIDGYDRLLGFRVEGE